MKAEVLRSVNDVDGLEDAGNHLPISSVKVDMPAFVVHFDTACNVQCALLIMCIVDGLVAL